MDTHLFLFLDGVVSFLIRSTSDQSLCISVPHRLLMLCNPQESRGYT